MEKVLIERKPPLLVVTIARPERRNAVDGETARLLADAFRAFDADDALHVAILTGAGGVFCAGADLHAVAGNDEAQRLRVATDGDGPMGPTRLVLRKPVIAAISGPCVAGGLELALWCDLRVADETAIFGVFCRRFGVPLIDGGTVRLPRVIGMGRALDMILTGRAVDADEALAMGLVNRRVPKATLMETAEALARSIAMHPATCMRNDRRSAYAQWGMSEQDAIAEELRLGVQTIASGETRKGAARFAGGLGRHGDFASPAADTPRFDGPKETE